MIYTLEKVRVVQGKKWTNTKEDVTLFAKLGMRWIGSWHGYTGNVNEIYNLWAYNDLEEMQKLRASRIQNPEFQKLLAIHIPLTASQEILILEPNPWSPMK